MLTTSKVKDRRIKRRGGCILCYNMGGASLAFAWIDVEFQRISLNPYTVVKEVGLCFKHCQPKTTGNPSGILDLEGGVWKKTPFGMMPIRDEKYQIAGGPTNTTLVTGPAGMIPKWW